MQTATRAGALVLLTRMSRLIHREVDPDELGMSMKEFSTLNFVRDADGVTQQELGTLMCVDANMVVNLLNSLERRGVPARAAGPRDRAPRVGRPTPAGRPAPRQGGNAAGPSAASVPRRPAQAERRQREGPP